MVHDPSTKPIAVRLAGVRFWQRCDALAPGSLIIKGSQALALRVGAARATQDIDMLSVAPSPADGDQVEKLSDLVRDAARYPADDGFTFQTRRIIPMTKVATIRVHLRVEQDGQQLTNQLTIDLGYRRYEPAIRPDMVTPEPLLGSHIPPLPLYPLPQHIADKACAIFEEVEGEESDRYRDLFDLVWIATQFDSIANDEMATAIKNEAQRRGVRLPRPFNPPSNAWYDGYEAEVDQARKANLTRPPDTWPDVADAVGIVDVFLNGGQQGQTWRPQTRSWA